MWSLEYLFSTIHRQEYQTHSLLAYINIERVHITTPKKIRIQSAPLNGAVSTNSIIQLALSNKVISAAIGQTKLHTSPPNKAKQLLNIKRKLTIITLGGDTRIISISLKLKNRLLATKIVNNITKETIKENAAINMASRFQLNGKPINNLILLQPAVLSDAIEIGMSHTAIIFLSVLLGLILSCFIVLLIYFISDIKEYQKIKYLTQKPMLGMIPKSTHDEIRQELGKDISITTI